MKQLAERLGDGRTPCGERGGQENEDGGDCRPVAQQNGRLKEAEFLVGLKVQKLLTILLKEREREGGGGRRVTHICMKIRKIYMYRQISWSMN